MSTATSGRAREYKVRDDLISHGWQLVARSAGSKGATDLVMAHRAQGIALVQVGTANKSLGPGDRTRFLDLAAICAALPIVAICANRQPIRYLHVNAGPQSAWQPWTPTEETP